MKRTIKTLFLGLTAGALMGFCPLKLAAQSEEATNLRRHAEELKHHLVDLREEGKRDEARAVQAKLEEVAARLRELQTQERERHGKAPDARPPEVRELLVKARELKAAGREEAARDLAERAGQMQRELQLRTEEPKAREPRADRGQVRKPEGRREGDAPPPKEIQRRLMQRRAEELEARRGREDGERVRRPEGPRGGEAPPPEEIQRRLEHVRVAMENLHAAGLHDVAQHLEQVAADLKHALHGPGPVHGPGPGMEPVQHLQAQIEELRSALGRLGEQMERLKRAVAEEREDEDDD